MILALLLLSMAPADDAGWVQAPRNRHVISYLDARSVRPAALGAVPGDEPIWSEFWRNRTGIHYADVGRVTVRGERRIVWHRVDFASPLPNGTVTAIYNVEIDCRRRLVALLAETGRDWAATLVRSRNIRRPRFRAVAPNSLGEHLIDHFCESSASP